MNKNKKDANGKNKPSSRAMHNKSERKKTALTKKQKRTILIVSAAVLTVVLSFVIVLDILLQTGTLLRMRKVKKSDDVYVNGAMMTFYFWDCFNTSLQNNESYYKSNGLSSAEDLDNPDPFGNPWRESFENTVAELADLYMAYAQYAVDNGITLSEEMLDEVEGQVEKFKDKAVVYGMSTDKFLSKYYGRGVKEQDVRDAVTLAYLSNEGFNAMYNSVVVTDNDISEYFDNNTIEFMRADYCFFVTGVSGKDNLTQEDKQFYSEKAEYISSASSIDEFKSRVEEYIREENDRLPSDSTDRLSTIEIEDYINDSLKTVECEKIEYNSMISFHDWIFSDERIPGDSTVYHEEPYGTYGAIYIITPAYIDSEWKENAKDKIISKEIEENIERINSLFPSSTQSLLSYISDLS